MVASLCILLLPVALAAVLVLVPSVVDLVRRPVDVRVWWAASFVVLLPLAALALSVPLTIEPGIEQLVTTMTFWGAFHTGMAVLWLAMACGLALSRGLRPGGGTLRRRRTSLVALLVLVPLMLVPFFPGAWSLAWLVPAVWAGVFWVLAFNRHGPARLERGKVVAASWLCAAALSWLLACAQLLYALELQHDDAGIGVGTLGVGLLGLAVLVGGLRYLVGSVMPGPLVLTALTGGSGLITAAYDWSFRPIPAGFEVPRWVDLVGRPGGALEPYRHYRCLHTVDHAGRLGERGPSCPEPYGPFMAHARAPLSAVRAPDAPGMGSFEFHLLVEDGRSRLPSWGRMGAPVRVELRDGAIVVHGEKGVETLPAALENPRGLHTWLRSRDRDAPLQVVRNDTWTVQDFVSMCASLGEQPVCELVDP